MMTQVLAGNVRPADAMTAAVQAINTRDYPVIQSVALLLALVVVVTSLITDVLYGVLDPRIRTQ